MKAMICIVLLLLTTITGIAQDNYYSTPLKIPLQLSASFGELRSNHFHSGIDIKTQGTTGLPVNAVANGFISRIVVSPSGYGNALYIDHPNGTTTVYGHLKKFRNDIQQYVRDIQYKNQSFKVDVAVPPGTFPVIQNEIIAESGNSGSSGGPHLHFEIRDTKTEEPLNPLKYNLPVNDKTAPKLFSLLIEPLSDKSHVSNSHSRKIYPVVFYDGKYHIKSNPVIPVYGNMGFAIQANDYFDNSWNKCGIYSLELYVDGIQHFQIRMDRLSFSQSRYINSYINYEMYVTQKRRYQKTWIEPGNKLSNYSSVVNRGIININDEKVHQVKMVLKDTYANTSELEFNVKGHHLKMKTPPQTATAFFNYNKENSWQTNDFQIDIPKGALYTDLNFQYKEIPDNDFFSAIHVVDKSTVPLQKSATIKIKSKNLPYSLNSKALVVSVDTLTRKISATGGLFKNGWVEVQTNYFGNYAVAVDTVSPTILPLSITNKNALTETSQIRFKIDDNLSGVSTYEGIIDGKWALFEYDLKNKLIFHTLDKTRFEMNKRHTLILKVTDNKENTAIYEATFWK